MCNSTKHDSNGMYRAPIMSHDVPPDVNIVRPVWTESQKGSGIHKAGKCMNGKQLICMGVEFEKNCAISMERHCLRPVVALSAYLGNLIEDGDVVNVCAHADAEGTQIYIVVDDVYQSWCNSRYGGAVSLGACVPLRKAV
jgi:hypothetical protein